MNAVGIDVSKGKSMVAVMRPGRETVVRPFEIRHTEQELSDLAEMILGLDGETRVVMEATGRYHQPVASILHNAGIYVSVVNAMLIRNYGNNTIRKGKTDKKDAQKIANYAIDNWTELPRYSPEEDTRLALKNCYRQYEHFTRIQTMMKNNLVALLDTTFPGVNALFSNTKRADGSEKWVDFAEIFWHCECVSKLTKAAFSKKYQAWCRKLGYIFCEEKAGEIYDSACNCVCAMPDTETAEFLVVQSVRQVQSVSGTLAALRQQMQALAKKLPEYAVVDKMPGVGGILGPQLMAEIGDVRRFHSKKALVAFAGIDAPPCQSGTMDIRSRSISKRGSPLLRRTMFLVMSMILMHGSQDDTVYKFMDKKRAEGKPYKVYMMASANKFLRIYYAKVKVCLDAKETG